MNPKSSNMTTESWGLVAADPSRPSPFRTGHHNDGPKPGGSSSPSPSTPVSAPPSPSMKMDSLEQELRKLLKEEEDFRNHQRERQERLRREQQLQYQKLQHEQRMKQQQRLPSSSEDAVKKFRRYSDVDLLDGVAADVIDSTDVEYDVIDTAPAPAATATATANGTGDNEEEEEDDDDDDDSDIILPGTIITASTATESVLFSRSLDEDVEYRDNRNLDDDDDDKQELPQAHRQPPVYAVVVDTSPDQKSSDLRYYREITCTSAWFEEHIAVNPNNTCAKSLVAELCGIHLRIYYRNCPKDCHNKKHTKPVNKIATMLTFDPNSGLYNHLIRGKAYVIFQSSSSKSIRLSRRTVWNMQELVRDHKDIYHKLGADFSREGQIQLLKACVEYKKGKWVPRSLYGLAVSNSPHNGAGGIAPSWSGDSSHDPRRTPNTSNRAKLSPKENRNSRNNSAHTRSSEDVDSGTSDMILPTIPTLTGEEETDDGVKNSNEAAANSPWFIESYEIKDS
mmetsp:Transcript_5520/g.13286  ORF Transcript_5520/g.13286 Transcript_5520/m.13286 type:complete len:508 (+) Transcript_5520:364-1887(+)|eukprot:CAMPEP_0113460310 /NCGR_PEP_ID=MMETSP0014_2-20120614/10918_1 /TAXON_ID=2857 /ORGANISM="Nitzschia sp." /LENGTH=507 /DNA_ID=CAMNT_0000351953 /DNA_START=328 /DNA_END=1851 /DNA_ORIENTATION=+ /assembly_acc=CAM_ASM_000159